MKTYPKFLLLIGVLFFAFSSAANAEVRVALLIGNADYKHLPTLRNPEHDVRLIEQRLPTFQSIETKANLDQRSMSATIDEFAVRAQGADVALLYFAGHGMEIDGVNYLIPVDAEISKPSDAKFLGIPLQPLLDRIRAHKLTIIVLDSCRTDGRGAADARGNAILGGGFIEPVIHGDSTLVVYSARAGTVAEDGDGNYSPFAQAFASHLNDEGTEIRLLFGKVKDDVLTATAQSQEPWVYGNLGGTAFFLRKPNAQPTFLSAAPVSLSSDGGTQDDNGCASVESDPAAAIEGCSQIIREATAPPKVLSLTFNNLGLAYEESGQPQTALLDLNTAIRLNPDNAAAYSNRSFTDSDLNDYTSAEADATKALELDSSVWQAYLARAGARNALKNYDGAIDDADKAIAANPAAAEAFRQRAIAYSWLSKFDRSISDLTEALQFRAGDASLLAARGRAYNATGKYQSAIDDLVKAAAVEPDVSYILNDLAIAYDHNGDYDLAIKNFSDAIRTADDNAAKAVSYSNRAQTYKDMKNYTAARADLTSALVLLPGTADYLIRRGNLHYWDKQYEPALEDYRDLIALEPANATAFSNRANVYFDMKNYPLAIQDYLASANLDPSSDDVFNQLGLSYFWSADYPHAETSFSSAIKLKSDNAIYFQNLGNAYQSDSQKHPSEKLNASAVAAYETALKLKPDLEFSLAESCWIRATNPNETQTALAACDEAVALYPGNVDALDGCGIVEIRIGLLPKALADLNARLKIAKSSGTLYALGVAETRAGDGGHGAADISEANKLNPGVAQRYGAFGIGL